MSASLHYDRAFQRVSLLLSDLHGIKVILLKVQPRLIIFCSRRQSHFSGIWNPIARPHRHLFSSLWPHLSSSISAITRAFLLFSQQVKHTPPLDFFVSTSWVGTSSPQLPPYFVNKVSLTDVISEPFPSYSPWKSWLHISHPPSFFANFIISKHDWCICTFKRM